MNAPKRLRPLSEVLGIQPGDPVFCRFLGCGPDEELLTFHSEHQDSYGSSSFYARCPSGEITIVASIRKPIPADKMPPITPDLSPAKNPAKRQALIAARDRADREGVPVAVYVAPSTTRELYMGDRSKGLNVWFVRLASEAAPMDSELFETVAPQNQRS